MKDSTNEISARQNWSIDIHATVFYNTWVLTPISLLLFLFWNSGACVRLAEEQEVSIDTLTLEQLQKIDSRFEADVLKVWDYEVSVERKSSIGGTSKARVLEQIEKCTSFAKTL